MKKIASLILPAILSVFIGCNGNMTAPKEIYGFTVENWKARLAGFPKEDSYAFNEREKIACVADQITRDFIDNTNVTSSLSGLVKAWAGKYPHYHSADIFAEVYLGTKSFEKANDAIGEYNQEQGLIPPDYLARDLAGCTAAGIFLEGDILNWQFICDSGIAVLNKNGILKFKTPDEGPHSKEKNPYLEEILRQHGGFDSPQGRILIRSKFRNNPQEPFAYGALTGEETALSYVREGKEVLDKGDFVLLYTDGVGELIFQNGKINQNFVSLLKTNNYSVIKHFFQKRVSSEGTLVVYKN